MRIVDVQNCLTLYGGTTVKRVEAIATELRKAELLPKGGRGLNAPEIDARTAVYFILAVSGADRVIDAVQAATDLSALVNGQGKILIDELASRIADGSSAGSIRHVRVMANIPLAEIGYEDGHVDTFLSPSMWDNPNLKIEGLGGGFVGRIGHVGGAALVELALSFAGEDEEADWAGYAADRRPTLKP